jgi:hypothetical protein
MRYTPGQEALFQALIALLACYDLASIPVVGAAFYLWTDIPPWVVIFVGVAFAALSASLVTLLALVHSIHQREKG